MIPRAFQIQITDNVATLLDATTAGPVEIIGAGADAVAALEAIPPGHKIALCNIHANQAVMKYGARIGHAIRDIKSGEWVHLHNLASDLDERSGSLDLNSGAPTDTDHAYV